MEIVLKSKTGYRLCYSEAPRNAPGDPFPPPEPAPCIPSANRILRTDSFASRPTLASLGAMSDTPQPPDPLAPPASPATPAADGSPMYRIGRVCTERGHRGQGLTAQLLGAALTEIGDHPCRIDAQVYLVDMYAKFGFLAEGDEYLEDGIPHIAMRRDPAPSAGLSR